jgi:hypothetical protein
MRKNRDYGKLLHFITVFDVAGGYCLPPPRAESSPFRFPNSYALTFESYAATNAFSMRFT